MTGSLLTSAEAADALQVSVSSIKRWTDEGALTSVRTPGGHRRYTPQALHDFAASHGLPIAGLPPLPTAPPPARAAKLTLYQALAKGDARAVRRLLDPPQRSPAHAAEFFDDVVTSALREVGDRWEHGVLTVDREHRASHLLGEAVDRLRPSIAPNGQLALLACPPDEWHELPLRLVRLVLEWSGWRTELLGAALPWADARHALEASSAALMAFSARHGDAFQTREFERLVELARGKGTAVVVGGEWARGGSGAPPVAPRFRTLHSFERWLRSGGTG